MGHRRSGATMARGLALVAVVLLAIAGAAVGSALGFGGSSGSAAAPATVKVRSTALGRVLVDVRGHTLYLFEPDEFGRSTCYGKCAVAWPPLLTTGTPRAGAGAKATLLGTTKRKNGRSQVTYQGYPLYLFVQDAKPGQVLGQGLDGFGGGWYVLDPRGRKIEDGHHGGTATVKTRATALGRVLTDERGRTLYVFEADKGTSSACYGACAVAWPPVLTSGKPRAGAGAQTGLLGTTKRKGGGLQVTYRGQPLYYFVKDVKAGQTLGQGIDGFGAEWYVLARNGTKIEKHKGSASEPTPPTTTDDSGGGYGGGYGGG